MKVCFLKNVLLGARRYTAGECADIDATCGKQLVDAALAVEQTVEVESPKAAPKAARQPRRAPAKAVKS